jgi:hypothetical protein
LEQLRSAVAQVGALMGRLRAYDGARHLGVHARFAMPGRGTIALETSKATPAGGSARFAILSMSATSTGQDTDARARKLARGDGGKDLATVHGVIGGIGGFVEVASDSVRGWTVTIGLPLL